MKSWKRDQPLVDQTLDTAIHRINHDPVDLVLDNPIALSTG